MAWFYSAVGSKEVTVNPVFTNLAAISTFRLNFRIAAGAVIG